MYIAIYKYTALCCMCSSFNVMTVLLEYVGLFQSQ